MDGALSRAERSARSEPVRQRIAMARVSLEFTRRVIHYLVTIQAPFRGVDRSDTKALAAAQRRAIALGEPLSRQLKQFCREHDLEAYSRLIDVHRTLGLLVELPGRKRILR